MTKKLLMGNEAFAHAALEAGVRVVAGYPGTPSSELVETVAKLHASGAAHGVHVEWSTNEKAALELLAGASYTGARCLFTCKQVGLNVASDPLMCVNYIGVKGGLVLFVADDPGPISSQTEQDTRRFAQFAKIPVLDPATPEQGFAMMQAAFELSERYAAPVIVRPTTRVNHASAFFEVADETQAQPVPEEGFERGSKWIEFPRRAWEAHGEINDRLPLMARDFANDPLFAAFNPVFEGGRVPDGPMRHVCKGPVCRMVPPGPELGIMAGGVSAAYAQEALRILEERAAAAGIELPSYRFMQVGTPYPFPEEAVERFVEGVKQVLVLEELDHLLEDELLAYAGKTHAEFNVWGKLNGLARNRGENDVDDMVLRIASFFKMAPYAEQADLLGLDISSAFASVNENAGKNAAGATGAAAGATGAAAGTISDAASGAKASEGAGVVCSAVRDALANPLLYGVSEAMAAMAIQACDEADALFAALAQSVQAPLSYQGEAPLPVRPPVLCAGCPHRGSFYAVKRALRKRPSVLCGDIGCYTLGNAQPLDAVDTCLCMGAGITMAQGFAVAEPHKKCVAFVGDSTFFASGLTGVANAVYNGHDITVVVLDNATTAMTGNQPHPGTGVTLMGLRRKPISIEAVLRALGVECVVRANPLSIEEAEAAAREAIDFEGPSALLFEAPCVQLIKPAAPAVVDAQSCTGCKRCITEIGCPGIGFDLDAVGPKSGSRGQAFVDASLCNGCGLCTQLCPVDALQVVRNASENGGTRNA
ncbi:MAG: 4Fe-4S binding protein [Eggerthellaceae bacterium]|nr:4Fe-4S binding protein [Eggerthellaceae bacterium]